MSFTTSFDQQVFTKHQPCGNIFHLTGQSHLVQSGSFEEKLGVQVSLKLRVVGFGLREGDPEDRGAGR